SLLTVGPLDLEAFLGEQALVMGDELRQPLERRRRFQDESFHWCRSMVVQPGFNVGKSRILRGYQPPGSDSTPQACSSNSPLISTGMRCGSSARPTAERACWPYFGPNSS